VRGRTTAVVENVGVVTSGLFQRVRENRHHREIPRLVNLGTEGNSCSCPPFGGDYRGPQTFPKEAPNEARLPS
jgi:hypothetical protein